MSTKLRLNKVIKFVIKIFSITNEVVLNDFLIEYYIKIKKKLLLINTQ